MNGCVVVLKKSIGSFVWALYFISSLSFALASEARALNSYQEGCHYADHGRDADDLHRARAKGIFMQGAHHWKDFPVVERTLCLEACRKEILISEREFRLHGATCRLNGEDFAGESQMRTRSDSTAKLFGDFDVYRRSNSPKAHQILTEIGRRVPQLRCRAHEHKALLYERSNELHNAEREYTAALRCDPAFSSALYGRGSLRVQMGNCSEGMLDLRQAASMNSRFKHYEWQEKKCRNSNPIRRSEGAEQTNRDRRSRDSGNERSPARSEARAANEKLFVEF